MIASACAIIAFGVSVVMGFSSDTQHEGAGWFMGAIWSGVCFLAVIHP